MAGEDTGNTSVVSGLKAQPRKRLYILVVLVLAILLVASVLVYNHFKFKRVAVCSAVSTVKFLGGAPIGSEIQMANLAKQIQSAKDYQKDPDCLYELIQYDISASDINSASTNLVLLKRVYPERAYIPSLANKATSLSKLSSQISLFETIQQENSRNFKTLSNKP